MLCTALTGDSSAGKPLNWIKVTSPPETMQDTSLYQLYGCQMTDEMIKQGFLALNETVKWSM
ncbi:Hypothetical predicted protein [Pelobates cultripes]|uniref:Uncharacterized protein n=1 Tax=Pelobates cultripes TaxID=61616 RepID=A0AAD1VRC3_PELCU|nr:Hypothetical predicted protein [Pelobates cultripes]